MELSPRMCTVECLIYHQKRECSHNYVTDNVVLYSERMPYDSEEVTRADRVCAGRLSEAYKNFCRTLCSVPCQYEQVKIWNLTFGAGVKTRRCSCLIFVSTTRLCNTGSSTTLPRL
ncbi:unnamed protein product, partial [Larinioides sclopetarius]